MQVDFAKCEVQIWLLALLASLLEGLNPSHLTAAGHAVPAAADKALVARGLRS